MAGALGAASPKQAARLRQGLLAGPARRTLAWCAGGWHCTATGHGQSGVAQATRAEHDGQTYHFRVLCCIRGCSLAGLLHHAWAGRSLRPVATQLSFWAPGPPARPALAGE